MKILILNTYDITGGAARAAYRLHCSLLKLGIDSIMLVQTKNSNDYKVIGPDSKKEKLINLFKPPLDQLPLMFYPKRTKTLFSPAWFPFNKIVHKINKINPDIVHLHWITGGMLPIEDIAQIKMPIVWSLHDMWAFTGGCHYDEWCAGYKKNCGKCKVLGSKFEFDLSRKCFNRKLKTYSKIKNITFVGLSKWICDCAKNSSLLKDKNIINLPNPIDTNIFKPIDKKICRQLWNLPNDKKLILFGTFGATSDPRKGFIELMQALNKLVDKDIEFILLGGSKPKIETNFKFKTHYLGNLYDEISLVTLYNAVDILVVPSLQENLSNSIMEAMSCGTPVIAFNIGGNSDMIDHFKNGYLANPFDTSDLAKGIESILNSTQFDEFCINSREKVIREFDSIIVGEKYIELYENILNY